MSPDATPLLETLPRDALVPIAFEHMLSGMIVTRAVLPLVVLHDGGFDAMNEIAIDEWMGASPVYTGRMRALMGIDGDGVEDIMKALQLDVGFVHGYMSVAYELTDHDHGEFWLAHCGALLDAEPHGEDRVFGMCHTIEDPTFDATALATNPRARIRPVHRPPRTPADREPHCRWTITIDPANEPVESVPLTQRVATLPLASVPNERPRDRDAGGMVDYRGPLDTAFTLTKLADHTLIAVAREFQMQSHLLMAATDLALRDRFGREVARDMMRDAWLGASWITSERLARAQGSDAAESGAGALARVLALTPMIPPGFDRAIAVDGDRVHVALTPTAPGVFHPEHPGWCGALARGESAGFEGMVGGVDQRVGIAALTVGDDGVTFDAVCDPGGEPAPEPDVVAMGRIGLVSGWSYDPALPTGARPVGSP